MTAPENRSTKMVKIWSTISSTKIVNRKWPLPESSFSLLEALKSLDDGYEQLEALKSLDDGYEQLPWGFKKLATEIENDYKLLELADKINNTPIVMITGMLNAGKSSVTASFLSQDGQQRIPRGIGRDQGTHRFVLWMPEDWQPQVNNICQIIEALFTGSQLLSKEDVEAKKEYNATDTENNLLSIPLLAFDSQLNDIAILDCPDAQRKHLGPSGEYDPKTIREEFLLKAVKMCWAILFVTTIDEIEATGTNELLTRLKLVRSSLPLFLLINKLNNHRLKPVGSAPGAED
ncbi:MAG: hypothetical protein P9F75_04305 [Candidatus Contendobacter sp.]|nr:hypothetical protein [Candidatus Contendobacter sp.]